MSKFKELAGIEEKDIWRNQTNLKKAFQRSTNRKR